MKRSGNRLSLFNRLFLGYMLLLSILVLPCAVSVYSLSQLERYATKVAKQDINLSKTIEYLKRILPTIEAEGRRLVTLHKQDSYWLLLSVMKDFKEKTLEIRKSTSYDLIPTIEALDIQLDRLSKVARLAKANPALNKAPEITPVEAGREQIIKLISSRIAAGISRMEAMMQDQRNRRSATISTLSSNAIKLTVIVLAGAISFALMAPWFLYKYIKVPIDSLIRGTEIIGQGHFDQKIPVQSRDELGELAEAFNMMSVRLKELDKLKSDFIGMASHELKTPLASMIEAAKLLSESEIGTLNERQKKLVTILNQSMERFHRLIDELLSLSRLKARLEVIEKKPVDSVKLLSGIIQTLKPLAWEKKLEIELCPGSGLDPVVPVDEERFFRAMMNILHNAVKLSPGSAAIKILLDSTEETEKKWLRIGIVDAGPGIEPNEQKKIFDKFYQVQTLRKKDGAGLGLAIAREIIVAHGGKIWVESPPPDNLAVIPGKGAVFWSVLPCYS